MDFKRKHSKQNLGKVLVLGKGVTGTAVEKYLAAQGSRVKGVDVVDETNLDVSKNYDLCIASPGISEFSEFYMAAMGVSGEVISEVEFAWRESEVDSKWIAITGTNGKTTTTALTTHILRHAGKNAVAVGNIGETCISQVDGTPKIYVSECSSYQLASTRNFSPDACAILNITPDHIKWHKGLENYRKAKFKVFANVSPEALVFVEDSLMATMPKLPCRVVSDISSLERNLVEDAAASMQIKGEHNIQNAVCAAAICSHFGVSSVDIKEALCTFKPLEHRIEPCGEIRGVKFYNDSKATNVDSTLKALSAFPQGNVILLLGGVDKMGDLEPLVEACRGKVKHVICYGEAAKRFMAAMNVLAGEGVVVSECEHMKDAFAKAFASAMDGDVVLLSPACASFDEFSGFEERGRVFKELVESERLHNE